MTRGKYAVKAANRMAEVDDGIIAELRAKLAAVASERDEARRQAAQLRDRLATDLHQAARNLSAERIAEVTQNLIDEREARAADRERIGREVFAVFDKSGRFPQPAVMADLASVFGLSGRMGELFTPDKPNRHSRRMTGRRARLIQASIDANDRRI